MRTPLFVLAVGCLLLLCSEVLGNRIKSEEGTGFQPDEAHPEGSSHQSEENLGISQEHQRPGTPNSEEATFRPNFPPDQSSEDVRDKCAFSGI